ncbi:unnamed protein product [Echinostoma caproni]|uniref:Vac14_Fab1_bd domain-containing protein n=1 Tax=Echinostoma caproni TaxID=27848 RepID=A0A3P8I5N8_9TREM|nr:unnamed protein product [Echinostoma caproni]
MAAAEIERYTKFLYTDYGLKNNQGSFRTRQSRFRYVTKSSYKKRWPTRVGLCSGRIKPGISIRHYHQCVQNASLYHGAIIVPVIRMFHDNDSRVRYYACETLYNGVADPDLNVRQGALQCDRLLKEIVTEPDFPSLTEIVKTMSFIPPCDECNFLALVVQIQVNAFSKNAHELCIYPFNHAHREPSNRISFLLQENL